MSPAFDPEVSDYEVDLRPWEDVVDVIPTAEQSYDLTVDGGEVSSGAAATTKVANGEGMVKVAVSYGGATRQYHLHLKVSMPEAQYLKAPVRTAGDSFSYFISLSDDGKTLAVGAPDEDSSAKNVNGTVDDKALDSGAAYVYVKNETGWTLQAYIKSPDTQAGDDFGRAVSLSADGNILAVGAPGEDSSTHGLGSTADDNAKDSGAVFTYKRVGETWTPEAYIKGSRTRAADGFGAHLDLSRDGNTLAVGARLDDAAVGGVNPVDDGTTNAANSGALYTFARSGSSWTEQAYLKAQYPSAGDRLGWVLVISGDGNTLVAGAPDEDSTPIAQGAVPNENALSAGAAFVFSRTGSTWTQQAYLKSTKTQASDQFGGELGISADGNTLAVASAGEDSSTTGVNSKEDEAATDSGAVYVFARNGSTWTQQAYVKASNTGAGDGFGEDIAFSVDGNVMAIGAYGEASALPDHPEDDNAQNAGAVYMYSRIAGNWAPKLYLKSPDIGIGDCYGDRVRLTRDGHTLVVGAFAEDSSSASGQHPNDSAQNSGAVYAY
jgi:hypothetical protein